jgi:predicted Zn-dependent peptidase
VADAARGLAQSVASGLEVRVLPEAPERGGTARDARPELAPAGAWAPPVPETFKLASGVTVHLWSRPGLPLYSMAAVLRPAGEGAVDGAAQAGRAALLAEMLSQGTKAPALDAGGFAGALQEAGASFDAGADRAGLVVSVSGLTSGFDAAAGLWAGAITAPRLEGADLERERALRVKALLQAQEEPAAVAAAVASRVLMGDGHPYSMPLAGTPATVAALTPESVGAAYASLADPSRTEVFVVGSLDRARVERGLAPTLGRWAGAGTVDGTPAASANPPAERPGMTLVIVDRPGAVQTVIRWAAGGPGFSDASRTPVELANIALGGSFTSRLNQNLREKNGYTYGARSGLSADRWLGVFTAGTSVETRITGPALREFLSELRGLAGGNLTADELTKARRTARTSLLESLGTAEGMARLAAGRVLDGGDWAGLASELSRAESVTLAEANAGAKGAAWLTRGVLVLVGDRREILDALGKQQGLGLPQPVFLGAEGEPVKAPEPGRSN